MSCAYQDSNQGVDLKQGFEQAGKRLDMGKSCIRFKTLDDLDFATIVTVLETQDVESFIDIYENARASGSGAY